MSAPLNRITDLNENNEHLNVRKRPTTYREITDTESEVESFRKEPLTPPIEQQTQAPIEQKRPVNMDYNYIARPLTSSESEASSYEDQRARFVSAHKKLAKAKGKKPRCKKKLHSMMDSLVERVPLQEHAYDILETVINTLERDAGEMEDGSNKEKAHLDVEQLKVKFNEMTSVIHDEHQDIFLVSKVEDIWIVPSTMEINVLVVWKPTGGSRIQEKTVEPFSSVMNCEAVTHYFNREFKKKGTKWAKVFREQR